MKKELEAIKDQYQKAQSREPKSKIIHTEPVESEPASPTKNNKRRKNKKSKQIGSKQMVDGDGSRNLGDFVASDTSVALVQSKEGLKNNVQDSPSARPSNDVAKSEKPGPALKKNSEDTVTLRYI